MTIKTPVLKLQNQETQEFYMAELFQTIPFRDDMASMAYPFFGLSTKPVNKGIQYEHGGVKVHVSPSSDHGMPTIFDKDILIYCASLLKAAMKKGQQPSQIIRISAHDLLVATGRLTNDNGYILLKNALDRLLGVSISTSIKTNRITQAKGFHLIDDWEIISKSFIKKRMVGLQIKLSDWFYNSVIADNELLTINSAYFDLRKPLERRLYEIARKHCGDQSEWKITLPVLHRKTGALSVEAKFRFSLKQVVERNQIPDYQFTLDNDMVHIRNKNIAPKKPTAGRKIPSFGHGHSDRFPLRFDVSQFDEVKPSTYETCQKISRDFGMNYDDIWGQYHEWIRGKANPRSLDGAIINFFKKKAKETRLHRGY